MLLMNPRSGKRAIRGMCELAYEWHVRATAGHPADSEAFSVDAFRRTAKEAGEWYMAWKPPTALELYTADHLAEITASLPASVVHTPEELQQAAMAAYLRDTRAQVEYLQRELTLRAKGPPPLPPAPLAPPAGEGGGDRADREQGKRAASAGEGGGDLAQQQVGGEAKRPRQTEETLPAQTGETRISGAAMPLKQPWPHCPNASNVFHQ